MKNKLLATLLAAGSLMAGSLTANATPLTWRLDDVIIGQTVRFTDGSYFDYGVTLAGTFTYDADTNLYSNFDFTSQDGTGFKCYFTNVVPCNGFLLTPYAGEHYDYAVNNVSSVGAMSLAALNYSKLFDGIAGDSLLYLKFDQALTNAGGTVGFDKAGGSVEFLCPTSECKFDLQSNPFRSVRTGDVIFGDTLVSKYYGRVTSVSVPEPASIALFAFGFCAMALRRKKTLS